MIALEGLLRNDCGFAAPFTGAVMDAFTWTSALSTGDMVSTELKPPVLFVTPVMEDEPDEKVPL